MMNEPSNMHTIAMTDRKSEQSKKTLPYTEATGVDCHETLACFGSRMHCVLYHLTFAYLS